MRYPRRKVNTKKLAKHVTAIGIAKGCTYTPRAKKNFGGQIYRGKFKCTPRQSKTQIFDRIFAGRGIRSMGGVNLAVFASVLRVTTKKRFANFFEEKSALRKSWLRLWSR